MGIFNGQSPQPGGSKTSTLIAKDCRIDGKFDIDGCLHVDGRVSGNIKCAATVTIGQSGQVDGEINADKLVVSGKFDGTCHANQIHILTKGNFTGTLFSDELIIEPGGHFYGDSHSCSDKKADLELVHNDAFKQEQNNS